MKRDMDLAREILFEVEKQDYTELPVEISLEGNYTAEEIEYHVLLLGEAGLLVVPERAAFSDQLRPTRLTWQGHEFLEAARSDTNWARTRSAMGQAGGWVFAVAQQVLTQIVMQAAMSAIAGQR